MSITFSWYDEDRTILLSTCTSLSSINDLLNIALLHEDTLEAIPYQVHVICQPDPQMIGKISIEGLHRVGERNRIPHKNRGLLVIVTGGNMLIKTAANLYSALTQQSILTAPTIESAHALITERKPKLKWPKLIA